MHHLHEQPQGMFQLRQKLMHRLRGQPQGMFSQSVFGRNLSLFCVVCVLRSAAFCVLCVLRSLRSAFCCVLRSCVPLCSAFSVFCVLLRSASSCSAVFVFRCVRVLVCFSLHSPRPYQNVCFREGDLGGNIKNMGNY